MSLSPSWYSFFFQLCVALRRPLGVLSVLFSVTVAHATIGVSLQAQLGNPSGALIDPNNQDHYLQQHDQYVFDFNDHNGGPNWVSWDLTTADIGSSGRSNNFLPDPDLPSTFYHVVTADYTGSGYDRGHMCPSADRTITAEDNQVTFYLGQIIPQSPDNNQGVWASFEGYCRSLASAGNEVLITSGPSLFSGSRIPSGVAAIPGYTWKIVLVVPLGPGSAVSRVTPSTRVIALKIPNIAGVRTTPWENFVTSVAQIEVDTGFTFFSNLPSAVANALRTVVDGQSSVGSPSFVAQPSTQTTVVGGSVTFSVSATGDAPLSYQWLRNDDELIAGATSPTLTLSNVQATDLGSYYVVVTNAVGSATSNLAQLVIMGLPPTIGTSPASQTANAGSSVTFSVSGSGSPTLSYQWRKDGVPIASATSSVLTLANVQAADAANYDVVVTNSVNSVTSGAAVLAVSPAAPTITGQPVAKTASSGDSISFTVAANGTAPLRYQWRKDGVAISDSGAVSGANTATLLFTGVSPANAGSYDVLVTNSLNVVLSNAAALFVNLPPPTVLTWNFTTADPTSGLSADLLGGTVTQGNNNGTTPLLTAVSVSNSYLGVSGGNNAGAAARIGALNQNAAGSAYFEFTFTPPAGQQFAATAISFGMRSTATGPQTFGVFSSVDNFTTALANAPVPADSAWRLYAPTFTGVTGAAGAPVTFRLYGYNGIGSPSTNTANWRIDDLKLTAGVVTSASAPTITAQPAAQTATVGGSATFTVVASGTGPLTYQWRKNGVSITGNASAATDTLTLASVTSADARSYDCVVSNSGGSTPSAAALLIVNKSVATVTLGSLSFTYDGTPHRARVTTAPAGLNLVFTYNGSATAPTSAGSYSVVATIADANYVGSASDTLVIAKAPATITLGQTKQAWDNTPKSASVTTDPSGLAVSARYNGSTTPPTRAGRYNAAVTINDANYTGFTGTTFTITPPAATVTLSNLRQSYDGTPKSVSVTTSPANLDVIVFYDDSNLLPTNPGTYSVVATTHNANYAGAATGELIITATALVRHAPSVNGGIDGSVQMLLPEEIALNSSSYISGDLLAPGTPSLVNNSQPRYGGTEDGTGSATPADYTVTLDRGSVLRHVVRRTDAITLTTVDAPPAPAGTRNVSLNTGENAGDFTTISNLTLNSDAGQIAVPAGTYGTLTANSHSGFTLGVPNATEPAVYNLQALTLNRDAQIQIVGSVIITVADNVTVESGTAGDAVHPDWLILNVAFNGVTLNNSVNFFGNVSAPHGTITLNGNTLLKGNVVADRLTINGHALLSEP